MNEAEATRQQAILDWVRSDDWMMAVLQSAASLNLPDWCISAGFVRSKVWDMLHGYAMRTPLNDVDVAYYDASNLDEQVEKEYDAQLRERMPDVPWSVKNQARMHIPKGERQYTSTADALAKYPETCTAVGLRLDASLSDTSTSSHASTHASRPRLTLVAPLCTEDLMNMQVRPTPQFIQDADVKAGIYSWRVTQKQWPRKWPCLQVADLQPDGTVALGDRVRKAEPTQSEADELTEIALRSKAVWGYSDTFIAQCRAELTLTPAFICQNTVYVLESNGAIAGFYVLIPGSPVAVLDFLYVHPDYLKRGFGTWLWLHAMHQARQAGAVRVTIDADPHAEPFYTRMGAVRVGEVPSGSIPGRVIPQMAYDAQASAAPVVAT